MKVSSLTPLSNIFRTRACCDVMQIESMLEQDVKTGTNKLVYAHIYGHVGVRLLYFAVSMQYTEFRYLTSVLFSHRDIVESNNSVRDAPWIMLLTLGTLQLILAN